MKTILWFTALSMAFLQPAVSAQTELETLRERCSEQERKIRQLEKEVQQLQGGQKQATAPEAVAPAAEPSEKTDAPANSIYIVKAGDSVEKIARNQSCSLASLTKINGLDTSTVIFPGQRLKLPVAAEEKSATPAKSQSDAPASALAASSEKIHRIEQGETYASISRKYNISVNSLIAANPGVKATALRPGMKIRLSSSSASPVAKIPETANALSTYPVDRKASSFDPVVEPVSKPKPAVAAHTPTASIRPVQLSSSTSIPILAAKSSLPSPAPAKAPEIAAEPAKAKSNDEAKPAASPNTEKRIRSIKIEEQMTYGQFAAKHGTDAKRLNNLNGLDLTTATVLAKGSELYVPAQP